jgi:hypothetical protein
MKDQKTDPKMLLVGIGDYDWADESLGWSFVDRVLSQGYDFFDCHYRYRLKTEDSELFSKYDLIVFVSASQEKLSQGFELKSCIAASHSFYSEVGQAPEAMLHLTNELYKKNPKAYHLRIAGTEWGLQSYLSREGNRNMDAAFEFFDEQFLPSVLAVEV